MKQARIRLRRAAAVLSFLLVLCCASALRAQDGRYAGRVLVRAEPVDRAQLAFVLERAQVVLSDHPRVGPLPVVLPERVPRSRASCRSPCRWPKRRRPWLRCPTPACRCRWLMPAQWMLARPRSPTRARRSRPRGATLPRNPWPERAARAARPRCRRPAALAHPERRRPAPRLPDRSPAPLDSRRPSPRLPWPPPRPTLAAASTRQAPANARRAAGSPCPCSSPSRRACAPRGARRGYAPL